MDELVVRGKNLPTMPVGDVKQYVDIIGDALDGMKAQLSAAKHMNADKETIDMMERQINEYSAMRVQAQVELGKRTATLEKTDYKYGNQYAQSQGLGNAKTTKAEQLKNLNIDSKRASEYEAMARNEKTVNQYIEDTLADGKAPTKNGALKKIKEEKKLVEICDEGEDDTEPEFTGFKYSKIPIEKQKAVIDYCKGHELEPTCDIAKRFSLDYTTVNRLRGFINQTDPSTRSLNNRIAKMESEKAIYSEAEIKAREYTIDDAIDELKVMKNEFIRKMERMLEIRRSVVGGNRDVIQLIDTFAKEVKQLTEIIKEKEKPNEH